MTIGRIIGLTIAGAILLAGSPSHADSSSAGVTNSSSNSNTNKNLSGSTPASVGKHKANSASFPIKLLGFTAGFALGTPICAIRVPTAEEKYGVDDLTNKSNKKRTHIVAAIFYFPEAVLAGACEAPLWAFNNALANYDKPFSKEQFSLGDNEMPPKKQKDDIKGTSER